MVRPQDHDHDAAGDDVPARRPLTASPAALTAPPARRVVAVIDSGQVSGPGRQLAGLARQLATIGTELSVVLYRRAGRERPPLADYLDRAGVRTTVLEERGPLDVSVVRALGRALAAWRPDVVQTHGYKPDAHVLALRAAGARWPWVSVFGGATTENLKVRAYNRVHRLCMVRADRLVVTSRDQLANVRVREGQARVIHNAIVPLPRDGAPFDLAGVVTDRAAPLLGVVSRLSSEKGIDVFLRACAELQRRNEPFAAVIAGDGPDRAALERLRDDLGLAGRVHFLGNVTAVWSLYPQLDLVVLPSRSEGLPNVLLEALQFDRPAVATRVGAVPDVLTDANAGLLVDSEDVTGLADAITRALPLRESAAARDARAATVGRFSLDRRAHEYGRVYDELLGR